jgi:hypothetical protein
MGENMFTMKSEVVGRPSVASDDFLQSVDQEIRKRWSATISANFTHSSI